MKDLQLQNSQLSNRYNIREKLGRGSYAEIYVAEDSVASPQSPHKNVVIKALNVFMQNDLDADLERTLVENFQNEAIALDKVRHPNIISRLGHGTARDLNGTVFHYLVLEYLPGGDLSKHCRENDLSLNEALDYLEQICAGIGHAHKNGIIHRDIKPQNLLLTADKKVVKIADFGVARFTQSEMPVTRVGTNVYAPPEHSPMFVDNDVNFPSMEITPAADIYSLAKSAYVLITSQSPRFFANKSITELPFDFREKSWAKSLIEILNKATKSNPNERYQNVNDFWNELSKLRFLDDEQDLDVATKISARQNATPQPQYTKGFTPNAPIKAKFNTSRELKLKPHLTAGEKPPLVIEINTKDPIIPNNPKPRVIDSPTENPEQIQNDPAPVPPKPKSKFLRSFLIFATLIVIFAGSLYATYNLLRGYDLFPPIVFGWGQKLGTATTDVNLRSVPTARNNVPIGLVTKNSRVRIMRIENDWYEIVIIEHGRPKENLEYVDRGWAYGKYITLDE